MKNRIKELLIIPNFILPVSAISVLLIISMSMIFEFPYYNFLFIPPLQFPWIYSSGVKVVEGINEFNGSQLDNSFYLTWSSSITTSFIFYFIIVPTIIISYIKRAYNKTQDIKLKNTLMFLFALAFVIIFNLEIFNIWITIYQANELRETNDMQCERDNLEYEFDEICYKTIELSIMGNDINKIGSFNNKNYQKINLHSVDNNNSFYLRNKNYRFVFERCENDTLFKLFGVSDYQGKDPDFKNIDGRKGRIQISAEVSLNKYFWTDDDN